MASALEIKEAEDDYDRLLTSWAECRALLSQERGHIERLRDALAKIADCDNPEMMRMFAKIALGASIPGLVGG